MTYMGGGWITAGYWSSILCKSDTTCSALLQNISGVTLLRLPWEIRACFSIPFTLSKVPLSSTVQVSLSTSCRTCSWKFKAFVCHWFAPSSIGDLAINGASFSGLAAGLLDALTDWDRGLECSESTLDDLSVSRAFLGTSTGILTPPATGITESSIFDRELTYLASRLVNQPLP